MRELDLHEGPARSAPAARSAAKLPARRGAVCSATLTPSSPSARVFAAGLGSPRQYVPALHAAGITVFGLVGNVKTARRVKADGVDVVVAQGYEAGGHTCRVDLRAGAASGGRGVSDSRWSWPAASAMAAPSPRR